MARTSDQLRLIEAYQASTESLRRRVSDFVRRVWSSLDSYRDGDIARFQNAVIPVVTAGQRQMSSLTDAYLAQMASVMLGTSERPLGFKASEIDPGSLRGVEPAEVYRRPGVTVWWSLAEGKPLSEAVEAGLRRALSLADTDLQLAKTHSARRRLSKDERVVGYRRTLTGLENCGLCVLASTQRYHKGELMPIHPGCDCGVAPIYGVNDPGQVLDADAVDRAHDAIAERFGKSFANGREIDYRKVILVREHGEIGPVLTVKGQNFTSESDIS